MFTAIAKSHRWNRTKEEIIRWGETLLFNPPYGGVPFVPHAEANAGKAPHDTESFHDPVVVVGTGRVELFQGPCSVKTYVTKLRCVECSDA